jgi:hypothetical protein
MCGLDELPLAERDDRAAHDSGDARPEVDHEPEPELERCNGPAKDDDDQQDGDRRDRDDDAGDPGHGRVDAAAVVARQDADDRADRGRAGRADERREHRLAHADQELRQEIVSQHVGAEQWCGVRNGACG